MRRTKNLIISIRNKKKNSKRTAISWKTFNSKQINIMLPKLKKIIETINNTIKSIIKQKQEQVLRMLILALRKEGVFNMNQHMIDLNITNKNNVYTSFFGGKDEKKIINTTLNTTQAQQNVFKLMNLYMYFNKMIYSINQTSVDTLILPVTRTTYTVLRSPHADKKAREQFAKEIYPTKIIMNQYVSIMKYLNKTIHAYSKSFISSYKYNLIY